MVGGINNMDGLCCTRRGLIISAIAVVSGCSLPSDDQGEYKFYIEEKKLHKVNSYCQSSDDSASVEFQADSKIELSGRIRTQSPCERVHISLFSPGTGSQEDSAILRVTTSKPDSCSEECEATIEYIAELQLNKQPSLIDIYHSAYNKEERKVSSATV
jgi:hypothetical protein